MNQGGYGGPPGGGYPPGYGQGYAPGQQPGQPQQPQHPQQPQQQQGWGQPQQGQPQPQQQQQQQGWGQPQPQGYGPPPGGAPGYGAPQPGYGAPQMGAAGGPELRFDSELTGGDIFVAILVNYLLVLITLGIYMPWAICKLSNIILSKITLTGSPKGTIRFSFTGEGGTLLGKWIVGTLLILVTAGIYRFWFNCAIARWYTENLQIRADDGTTYSVQFTGDGGSMFGTYFVAGILTFITAGIYTPWAECKRRKWWTQNLKILENGQPVGTLDFVGDGGTLFGNFIAGALLTMVTMGIYASWFQCTLNKFFASNTKINWKGRPFTADFSGQGADLFVLNLINGLLISVTIGIYGPWAMAKRLKWDLNHHVVRPGS